MKLYLRFTALLLSLIILLSVGTVGCGDDSSSSEAASSLSSADASSEGNLSADNSSDNSSSPEISTSSTTVENIDPYTKLVQFKPLSAGAYRVHNANAVGTIAGRSNDILLYDNPDRGYRTTMPVVIYANHPDPDDPSKSSNTCDLIKMNGDKPVYNYDSKCHGKHRVDYVYANLDKESRDEVLEYMFQNVYFKTTKTDYPCKLILVQIQLSSYGKTEVLPDEVLDVFQAFIDKCKTRGVKVLFRLGYHMVQLNWTLSSANRAEHEKVGASEKIMLKHIDQLAPFIKKNASVIHKMSSGFIGSGGEMAYNYQYPVVNYDTIMKAVVEKLCVPNGLYYSCRNPQYKLTLLENDPDYKYAAYIGHNNDGVFGEGENYGWGGDCYKYNHNFDVTRKGMCYEADNGGKHVKNNWWEYVCETAAYTPQSGEMYHISSTMGKGKEPTGFNVIKQMAHHRFTTLSHWNSYIETSTFKSQKNEDGKYVTTDSVMQKWIDNERVTMEWLDENGIIYDPAWFYDDDGNVVERNPYEFMRDHLGYKLVAQKMILQGDLKKGKTIAANMTLKNYGFAAAFNLESGFMILDENYNVVSSIKSGKPETWYSHDPNNWKSTTVLEHSITADLKLPSTSGKYYIAFYLKNTMDDYAKLSNNMPYQNNKYNILYEFNV